MSDAHSRESWGRRKTFLLGETFPPPAPVPAFQCSCPDAFTEAPAPPNLASTQHNSWRSGTSRPLTIFMWPSASWTGLAGLSRPEESHSRW